MDFGIDWAADIVPMFNSMIQTSLIRGMLITVTTVTVIAIVAGLVISLANRAR